MFDLWTVIALLVFGFVLVLVVVYIKTVPHSVIRHKEWVFMVILLIITGGSATALLVQTDYQFEYCSAEYNPSEVIIYINGIKNTNISIRFENSSDLLYRVEVGQYHPLDSFFFGRNRYANQYRFDGHDFAFRYLNITLSSQRASSFIIYGTDLNTTIVYSTGAELSNSVFYYYATGIVGIKLDETCRQSDPDKGMDIRIHYAYLTLVDIDLPANTIGVLNFHESTTRTILHLDGWYLRPWYHYSTVPSYEERETIHVEVYQGHIIASLVA